ncbi:hypothetical protein DFH06DRAFT_1407111 [Mycena polygramma]|nr:hypothetical protein DFH06DRAFT_1407111 [Mycena polygramma]
MDTGTRLLQTAPRGVVEAVQSRILDPPKLAQWMLHCTLGYCWASTSATENHSDNRPSDENTVQGLLSALEANEGDFLGNPLIVTPSAASVDMPDIDLADGQHPQHADGSLLPLLVVSGWHRMSALKKYALRKDCVLGWWAQVLHPVFWDILHPAHRRSVFITPNLPVERISNPASVADQLSLALNIIVGAEKHEDRAAAIRRLEETLAPFLILSGRHSPGPAQEWRIGVRLLLSCPEVLEALLLYLDDCPLLRSWEDVQLSQFILKFAKCVEGCEDYVIDELRRLHKEENGSQFTPDRHWAQFKEDHAAHAEAYAYWTSRAGERKAFNKRTFPAYFEGCTVKDAIERKGGAESALWLTVNAVTKGWFRRNTIAVRMVMRVIALALGGPDTLKLVSRVKGSRVTTITATNIQADRLTTFRTWLLKYIMAKAPEEEPQERLLETILPEILEAIRTKPFELWNERLNKELVDASGGFLMGRLEVVPLAPLPGMEVKKALADAANKHILSSPSFHHILVKMLGLVPGQPFDWAPMVQVTDVAPGDANLSLMRRVVLDEAEQAVAIAAAKAEKARREHIKARDQHAEVERKLAKKREAQESARQKAKTDEAAAVANARKQAQQKQRTLEGEWKVELDTLHQERTSWEGTVASCATQSTVATAAHAEAQEAVRRIPDMDGSAVFNLLAAGKEAPLEALVRAEEEEATDEEDNSGPTVQQIEDVNVLLRKIPSHRVQGLMDLMKRYIAGTVAAHATVHPPIPRQAGNSAVADADAHADAEDDADADADADAADPPPSYPPPPSHQQAVTLFQNHHPPSPEAHTTPERGPDLDLDGDVDMHNYGENNCWNALNEDVNMGDQGRDANGFADLDFNMFLNNLISPTIGNGLGTFDTEPADFDINMFLNDVPSPAIGNSLDNVDFSMNTMVNDLPSSTMAARMERCFDFLEKETQILPQPPAYLSEASVPL